MTPARLMRTFLPSHLLRTNGHVLLRASKRAANISGFSAEPVCDNLDCSRTCRCFVHVRSLDTSSQEIWFTSSAPYRHTTEPRGENPPDERTLQLGKTVRTLHEQLPTLLLSPLPLDILSPQISLHLFPSTHPHLPTVSGRIAYVAALWTAPVAWGRVPLVGNVKLSILSERMVRNGSSALPTGYRDEKLIVKWKTCGKTRQRDGTEKVYRGAGIEARDSVDKIERFIKMPKEEDGVNVLRPENEEFCGIFVFEFDEEGRIVRHTIEHTDEGGDYDKMTRVVSVTDWLLGHLNSRSKERQPELAFCEDRPYGGRTRIMSRTRPSN